MILGREMTNLKEKKIFRKNCREKKCKNPRKNFLNQTEKKLSKERKIIVDLKA